MPALLGPAAALALALPLAAQEVPSSVDEVARPGGDLPGDPEIALVKVAGGFNDPVASTIRSTSPTPATARAGSSWSSAPGASRSWIRTAMSRTSRSSISPPSREYGRERRPVH
jgi:hypothetical protein